ncbi:MAG: hypothetical protein WB611_23235 [Stellaceae bacterium]
MADHPRPARGALADIAELLLYQRIDVVVVAVVMTAGQILAPHYLWFVRAPLITFMGYAVVCREHAQHRRGRLPRCG